MINYQEIKNNFSQCLHLLETDNEDGWIRFIDFDTGSIIGFNDSNEEIAVSTAKEEYRNLDENSIKKLLFIHQSKSAMFEQALKKKIIL